MVYHRLTSMIGLRTQQLMRQYLHPLMERIVQFKNRRLLIQNGSPINSEGQEFAMRLPYASNLEKLYGFTVAYRVNNIQILY